MLHATVLEQRKLLKIVWPTLMNQKSVASDVVKCGTHNYTRGSPYNLDQANLCTSYPSQNTVVELQHLSKRVTFGDATILYLMPPRYWRRRIAGLASKTGIIMLS